MTSTTDAPTPAPTSSSSGSAAGGSTALMLAPLKEDALRAWADDLTHDEALAILNHAEVFEDEVRAAVRRIKAGVLAYVVENGPLTVGSVRYRAGVETAWKCRDNYAVMRAVFEASGGDEEKVADVMASGAWKQGSIRKLVGDEKHAELFERVTKDVLEKKLIREDTQYLPAM